MGWLRPTTAHKLNADNIDTLAPRLDSWREIIL